MTLTEEPSGLWRLDTGGTLVGYDGEHNVCSIQINLAGVTGTWTWYLDIAYLDGTVATVPLERVKDTISVLLSRCYMREGLTVVQVRGVSAGSSVKKSSVARVRFGSSVNASEQLAPPTPSQWDIYAAQVAGYRDEAADAAAAAALAATQMPYINSGGTWSVWAPSAGGFVDSGVSAAGVTPDIQIGTVTTLPAGSAATASMSGTTAAPLLNLGIPKGDPGSGGGTSALYMRVDNGVIQYSTDGLSWSDLITTAELTGPAGSPGEQGPPGSDGVSPTLTVIQTETGAVITATDASGTTSATVSNGQAGPPGLPGTDGSPGADGVTPDIQIGTVTTLPAGSAATASMSGTTAAPLLNLGIPKGDKGDKGDGGSGGGTDIALGITSATTGQIPKIKTVDSSGVPTAWEAVDLPGGGEKEWELVADVVVESEDVLYYRYDVANKTECYVFVSLTPVADSTATVSGVIGINGTGNPWGSSVRIAGTMDSVKSSGTAAAYAASGKIVNGKWIPTLLQRSSNSGGSGRTLSPGGYVGLALDNETNVTSLMSVTEISSIVVGSYKTFFGVGSHIYILAR